MAETRTYQGHTYTRNGPGEPWALVAPAQQPSAGFFINDPKQPVDVRKGTADASTTEAGLPFVAPKAAADTRKARADADAAEIKADADRRAAEDARRAEALKKSSAALENDIVLKNIREARELIKNNPTTGAAAVLSVVPGSRARRLSAVFDTVKSNLTFDKLQQIRDESKTGASVGQATDNDMRLLGATAGSLDQYQKDTDLLNVLDDIERRYLSFGADNLGIDRDLHSRRYHFPQRAADMFAQGATREQIDAEAGPLGLHYGPDLDTAIAERDNPNVNVRFDGFNAAPSAGLVGPDGAPAGGGYNDSLLSQGLSGTNEGIANTLGMPVDLLTSGLNLIPTGINALANTNIGTIENPIGGGEWWQRRLADTGAIGPESNLPGRPFVRRVGQSVGAAAIPVAGTATTLGRGGAGFLTALGGGIGGATAREVAPNNPYAEVAGELIGSGLTGAGLLTTAQRGARRTAEAAVPTVDQLKKQASDLYRQAEARGVVAGPNVTGNLAGRARQIAQDEVAISQTGKPLPGYDSVNSSVTLLDDFANKNMSAREIDRVRRAIAGNIQKSSDNNERRINKLILDAFDEETLPLAPEFSEARGVAARYLQAGDVDLARRSAETRATQFSRAGEDNAIRTDFRALERRINKGEDRFFPGVEDAIRTAVRGGPGRSVARWIGGLSPSTQGGNIIPGLTIGGAGGLATGDPVLGALIGGGSMAAGVAGRATANALARRDADVAHLLARAGGEINFAPVLSPDIERMIALSLAGQTSGAAGAGQ